MAALVLRRRSTREHPRPQDERVDAARRCDHRDERGLREQHAPVPALPKCRDAPELDHGVERPGDDDEEEGGQGDPAEAPQRGVSHVTR